MKRALFWLGATLAFAPIVAVVAYMAYTMFGMFGWWVPLAIAWAVFVGVFTAPRTGSDGGPG